MERTVLKLGGIALGGTNAAAAIEDILDSREDPLVVVVPAFKGVAKVLAKAADCRATGHPAPEVPVAFLREGHLAIAEAMDAPSAALAAASLRLERILRRLFALLSADEGAPVRAEIIASGARLSATCVALAFAALGRPAPIVEPAELGLVASEGPKGLRVDLEAAGPRIRSALERFPCSVLPGAYGVDADGRAVLFGRDGSRRFARVIAAALGARLLDAESSPDRPIAPAERANIFLAHPSLFRERMGVARKPGVA
jgi:bifunctional aspartokinase / homoserine dehydrogenase 1